MLGQYPITSVLPTTDMARARRFYTEKLGLNPVEMPGVPEDQNIFFDSGGTMLTIYYRPEPTRAEHTALGWMVADLDAAIDDLLGRGVTFTTYPDLADVTWDERGVATSTSGYRGAWITDPDGNILSVGEMPG